MHSPGQASATVLRSRASVQAPVPQVSLAHRIETPENVVLTYQLAGPTVRLLAYLMDLLLLFTCMSFATIILAIIATAFALIQMSGLVMAVILILMFLAYWWFFSLSEWFFRGRTLGKRLMRLQVIQDGGYPLTFRSAVLRNFFRLADMMPTPTCVAGLATMLVAGQFRRTGDLFARTIVIEESRVALPTEPIILERIQPLSRTEIGGFVPAPRTLTLIEQFLGRRHVLSYRRGHRMASILAEALAKRLDYKGDRKLLEKYPMAFLASVYATFHRTLDEDAEFAREASGKTPSFRKSRVTNEARPGAGRPA